MSYYGAVQLNVGELADRAGLSRRAIRFYVQQGLLPSPHGLGRGSYYDEQHLTRLKHILELQSAGHSLDAIRRILDSREQNDGEIIPPLPAGRAKAQRSVLSAQLWTRIAIAEGIELHFDNARRQPTVEQLMAARDALRRALEIDSRDE